MPVSGKVFFNERSPWQQIGNEEDRGLIVDCDRVL
jgi:hypothetical protein